ncbi:MAG: DegV family protein [Caldilineae bacterium]|nr:MAG: DegV family protein [Caldilineae bacterium]
MTRIAIVTDSTCDMPAEWDERRRVHVIPIHIRFGEESFLEGIEIDENGFYDRVNRDGVIPQTSQPNPEEFASFYRSLSKEYDAVISMHVTARLSGTYQSAAIAADMVKDEITVRPYDSACGSAGLGFMAREALALIDQGGTLESVLARLDTIRRRMNILLTPETLKYAAMSGRVSSLGHAMASLLNIKPIIVLDEGELIAGERVRTRRRAWQRMVEMMQERLGNAPANVAVVHARDPQSGKALQQLAESAFNCERVWLTTLAPSVAVHLGPGTVGLVGYRL